MRDTPDYEANYSSLPFEDTLRHYRRKVLLKVLQDNRSSRILEIGPGSWPVCTDYTDFERMVIVEPGAAFFRTLEDRCAVDPRISMHQGYVEEVAQKLTDTHFDMVIIGGFLHEIDNPEEVLKAVSGICKPGTRVYSLVPNSRSFHRLLAVEAGLIAALEAPSELDRIFHRRKVYDRSSFSALFESAGFTVLESGSYFLKPFTHGQMQQMLDQGLLTPQLLDGLEKMIHFFPEMGAEIFVVAQKK